MVRICNRLADVDIFNSGDRYDITRAGLGDFCPIQALEAEQLLNPSGFLAAFPRHHGDWLTLADYPAIHPANGDTPQIFIIIHQRNQDLQRLFHVLGRSWDMLHDRVIKSLHIAVLLLWIQTGSTIQSGCIYYGEFQLLIVCLQLDEQIKHLIDHLGRPCGRTIDFIHNNDGCQLVLKRLA
ncbi:hypothetical protein D3C77_392100 [compost metagenome]